MQIETNKGASASPGTSHSPDLNGSIRNGEIKGKSLSGASDEVWCNHMAQLGNKIQIRSILGEPCCYSELAGKMECFITEIKE